MIALAMLLFAMAAGGVVFAFAGGEKRTQRRIQAVARPQANGRSMRGAADTTAQRRKNVQTMLKDIEKKQSEQKTKVTIKRRLERAGFPKTRPRTYWTICGLVATLTVVLCQLLHQTFLVMAMAAFAAGLGLPLWVLGFLKNRREKRFTAEFANAIDVIVRSVKSGLPTNEALRIVAREVPNPVGSEFSLLCESLKVGVTLDQGLKRMYESMPTAEVGFFGIVMTIQQKSGGNLSEALNNLASVLRDRKRLEGKIKAMSSEAKASAAIIGSLPPGVMGIVWLTTPSYIELLFTEKAGNLMLAACVIWMGIGIAVMRKMINFKH